MPSGEPREAVGEVTEAADGLGESPDGAPTSHLPDGPTTTGGQPSQPAWPTHPGFSNPQELRMCQ